MEPAILIPMILWGVVAPFIASLMASAAIWWSCRGEEHVGAADGGADGGANRAALGAGRGRIALAGLCVAAATLGSIMFLSGVPDVPPREAMHFFPWMVLAGLVLGLAELFIPVLGRQTGSWVCIVILGYLLPRYFAGKNIWVADAAFLWMFAWSALKVASYAAQRSVSLVSLGIYSAGAAVILATVPGNMKLALACGAMACAVLGVFVVSRLRPRATLRGPGVCAVCALVGTALGQGVAIGDVPRVPAFVYGLLAPVLVLFVVPLLSTRLKPFLRPLVAGGLIVVVAAAVAAWVFVATSALRGEN